MSGRGRPQPKRGREVPQTKMIIDCDGGTDDAFALMVALAQPDVDILAITCVVGNTKLDNVCVNVMKVLELCNRTDIPVYKGCSTPLMGGETEDLSFIFGKDGFGDVADIPTPDMSKLKTEEHAANAIIRLAREHPGEITLAAVAPLTNISLACRLDPMLSQNLKRVVIMGGNDLGCAVEFNFKTDPEAASICLNELTCPVSIVTWECCLRHSFGWEFYDKITGQCTEKSNFFKKIDEKASGYYKKQGWSYTCCDMLAMAIIVEPDMVKEETPIYATVELNGENKGQVVEPTGSLKPKKQPNLMLLMHCDMEKCREIALDSLA